MQALGTAEVLCGGALQGYSSVARILCGWPLQGNTEVIIPFGSALHEYSAVEHYAY